MTTFSPISIHIPTDLRRIRHHTNVQRSFARSWREDSTRRTSGLDGVSIQALSKDYNGSLVFRSFGERTCPVRWSFCNLGSIAHSEQAKVVPSVEAIIDDR